MYGQKCFGLRIEILYKVKYVELCKATKEHT